MGIDELKMALNCAHHLFNVGDEQEIPNYWLYKFVQPLHAVVRQEKGENDFPIPN